MAQPDVIAQLTAALVQQQTYIDQISDGQPIDEETYRQMSNLSGQAHAAARALAAPPGDTNAIPNLMSTNPESLADAVRNRHRTTSWLVSLARDADLVTQGRALQALLLLRVDGIFRIRELIAVPGFMPLLVGYVGDAQAVFRSKMALELLQQLTHNRIDEFKTALVEAGGIEVALRVVVENTFHDRERALRVLQHLASDQSVHHTAMREKGVIDAYVRLLDASATQTLAKLIIQKLLVETLHLFVVRKEKVYIRDSHLHTPEQKASIRAIVDAGAIAKLVELFRSARTQPEVQNETALVLSELCEDEYGKKGFCPVSVNLISAASVAYLEGAGPKVRGVCRLITGLANESSLYRCILWAAEVVGPLLNRARVVQGAQQNVDRANSRAWALGALAALTSGWDLPSDKPIAHTVVAHGAIGICMYAMDHPHPSPSHEGKEFINAGCLLTNLANDRLNAMAMVNAGAVRICSEARGNEMANKMLIKLLATLVKTLAKPVNTLPKPPSPPRFGDDDTDAEDEEYQGKSRKRARGKASR